MTDPARLARWFAPVSGDLREGGTFVIHFDDADTPSCRVESCSAPNEFTWTWPHSGVDSTVQVAVTPDGEGSRLRLVHNRLTRANAAAYAAGWQAYVHQLDAHIDGTEAGDWWPTWEQLHEGYAATL